MNTKNNKRKRTSCLKIENAFLNLIQDKDITGISVCDICKHAGLNRSTFYANYIDINDLVGKIKLKMFHDFLAIYQEEVTNRKHSYNFLKLFYHIQQNQSFYNTYFKLRFDLFYEPAMVDDSEILKFYTSTKNMDYHVEFFKAGLNALIKKWLQEGCLKSPEEMNQILIDEYQKKNFLP